MLLVLGQLELVTSILRAFGFRPLIAEASVGSLGTSFRRKRVHGCIRTHINIRTYMIMHVLLRIQRITVSNRAAG